jgi:hypothetical protein
MSDNIDKYLPEFDEDGARSKLASFTRQQLLDMLVYAYKEKRLWAKMLDGEIKKLERIQAIITEPSSLTKTPGIPSDDDLRRMMGEE